MGKLMVGVTRFLLLCALLLVLPTLAASQSTQPSPGWYKNSGPPKISEDSTWRVSWQNSYIYQHPGTDNLYWYAKVEFRNVSTQNQNFFCNGVGCPSCVKEHIKRGGTYLGYVTAADTFCLHNPNFVTSVNPGGAFYDWVIFHNVPWQGDEVSLEWGSYGATAYVNPWYFPLPDSFSSPAECPQELVSLGTCQSQPAPNIPHPGAYEIAQKITDFLKRLGILSPSPDEQPTSFVDGIIGAACLAGTFRIGLPQGFIFEVKCVKKLQEVAKNQCQVGDYVCFTKYLVQHPEVILDLVNEVLEAKK